MGDNSEMAYHKWALAIDLHFIDIDISEKMAIRWMRRHADELEEIMKGLASSTSESEGKEG